MFHFILVFDLVVATTVGATALPEILQPAKETTTAGQLYLGHNHISVYQPLFDLAGSFNKLYAIAFNKWSQQPTNECRVFFGSFIQTYFLATPLSPLPLLMI